MAFNLFQALKCLLKKYISVEGVVEGKKSRPMLVSEHFGFKCKKQEEDMGY